MFLMKVEQCELTMIVSTEDLWKRRIDIDVVPADETGQAVQELIEKKRKEPKKYAWFYDNVLSCVTGKNKWRRENRFRAGTEMATASDEALALLLFENLHDCMVEEVNSVFAEVTNDGSPVLGRKRDRRKREEKERRTKRPKYTDSSDIRNERKGWSEAGMQRYNDLVREVREDRAANGAEFDKLYMELKVQERGPARGDGRREMPNGDSMVEIMVMEDDLSDDDGGPRQQTAQATSRATV